MPTSVLSYITDLSNPHPQFGEVDNIIHPTNAETETQRLKDCV